MGVTSKWAWTVLAVIAATSAFAQASPSSDETRDGPMDISGYAIEGRILLESGDFTRIIAPFVGRRKSAAEVELTRNALLQAYRDLGHYSVEVRLAKPEPQDGVITFHVAEKPASESRDYLPMIVLNEQPVPVLPVDKRSLTESRGIMPQPSSRGTSEGAVIPVVKTEPVMARPASFIAQAESVKTAPAKPLAEISGPVPAGTAEIMPVAPVVSPKFEIRRYLLEGNTLLAQESIDRVLAPFVGQNKDFGDVQQALETLQAAYQRAGYGSVEIRLPEQELERGEVRIAVIEAKIGKITVEGNKQFSNNNIRRSVPSLQEGVTPNSREIAQSIRLANESPAKQSAVLLRGTDREGQVDAVIRVTDIEPARWSTSLDNTGNESTGRARLGFAYQHANIFDRDHVLTAQYITSPTKFEEVNVVGAGYRIPFYSLGDSMEFVAGYSKVDSGIVQGLFAVSGQGAIYGARYNQALSKWRELEHKFIYGLDYRAYQNLVSPTGTQTSLVPDVTVHPFSLTYSANLRGTGQDVNGYLNVTQNIPGGNDGQDEDFKKQGARFGVGSAGYRLYRAGFNYVRVFKADYQFRANFSAQYTDDALVAPEQFGIGGADSVRGFNERYVASDKGHRASLEIYTPDVAKAWGLGDGRLRFLVFYDTGALGRNYTAANEKEAAHLDSGGVGLRWNHKNYFSARMDVAQVLHDGSGLSEPDSRRNIRKLHLSMSWVW